MFLTPAYISVSFVKQLVKIRAKFKYAFMNVITKVLDPFNREQHLNL